VTETSASHQLLRRLVALVDELLSIDLNLDDQPGALASAAMRAPATLTLVDRADVILGEVLARYGDGSEPSDDGADHDADYHGAEVSPTAAICNLASVCRAEIRPCRHRLEAALAGDNPVKVVAVAGEAVRRLCGALHPLETAVARVEGREPPTRVWWDLEISLEVRRIYADLRSQLNLEPAPDGERIRQGLVDFTLRFDDLKEREIYRFLRYDDRVHLGALLRRTRVWLRQGDQGDPDTGLALWKELTNLIEIMRQVSNRAELREFDRQVLDRACTELFDRQPRPPAIPLRLRDELADLVGLDSELDWLLANAVDHPPKFWEHCLRRLARRPLH
jgi:hypothetical protein